MKRIRVSGISVACANCLSQEQNECQATQLEQTSSQSSSAAAACTNRPTNTCSVNIRKAQHDGFLLDVCYAAGKRNGLKTTVENNTIVMTKENDARSFGVMSHVFQGRVITTDGSVDRETFERFCSCLHVGPLHVDPDEICAYDLVRGDNEVVNAMDALFHGASQCSDGEEMIYSLIIAKKIASIANRAIMKQYTRLIEHGEIT
jgi:hypothetical protein